MRLDHGDGGEIVRGGTGAGDLCPTEGAEDGLDVVGPDCADFVDPQREYDPLLLATFHRYFAC